MNHKVLLTDSEKVSWKHIYTALSEWLNSDIANEKSPIAGAIFGYLDDNFDIPLDGMSEIFALRVHPNDVARFVIACATEGMLFPNDSCILEQLGIKTAEGFATTFVDKIRSTPFGSLTTDFLIDGIAQYLETEILRLGGPLTLHAVKASKKLYKLLEVPAEGIEEFVECIWEATQIVGRKIYQHTPISDVVDVAQISIHAEKGFLEIAPLTQILTAKIVDSTCIESLGIYSVVPGLLGDTKVTILCEDIYQAQIAQVIGPPPSIVQLIVRCFSRQICSTPRDTKELQEKKLKKFIEIHEKTLSLLLDFAQIHIPSSWAQGGVGVMWFRLRHIVTLFYDRLTSSEFDLVDLDQLQNPYIQRYRHEPEMVSQEVAQAMMTAWNKQYESSNFKTYLKAALLK